MQAYVPCDIRINVCYFYKYPYCKLEKQILSNNPNNEHNLMSTFLFPMRYRLESVSFKFSLPLRKFVASVHKPKYGFIAFKHPVVVCCSTEYMRTVRLTEAMRLKAFATIVCRTHRQDGDRFCTETKHVVANCKQHHRLEIRLPRLVRFMITDFPSWKATRA